MFSPDSFDEICTLWASYHFFYAGFSQFFNFLLSTVDEPLVLPYLALQQKLAIISSGKKVHAPAPSDENAQNLYINYLSSDLLSITSTYFLNSAHPSLKYGTQFFLIHTPQNPLHTLEKLVLISQLNPFEFSLTVGNK
jgi:hypothetical protein